MAIVVGNYILEKRTLLEERIGWLWEGKKSHFGDKVANWRQKKKRRRRRIYVVRRRRLGSIRLNLWPGKLVLLNLAERAYTEWRVVKATFICSNCLCNYVAGEGAFNRYTSSRPLQIRPVIRRAFVNRPFVKADVLAFLLNFYFFFFFFLLLATKRNFDGSQLTRGPSSRYIANYIPRYLCARNSFHHEFELKSKEFEEKIKVKLLKFCFHLSYILSVFVLDKLCCYFYI